MLIIRPYNALPSWIGYEKQGHVALYLALKKISELLAKGKGTLLHQFFLEIEGAEDLSIKKNDTYLTMHQVKTGELSLSEADKFCHLITLLQHGACRGYFHINKDVHWGGGIVSATLSKIKEMKVFFSRQVTDESKTSDSKNNDKFIFVEDVKGNLSKSNGYAILYFVLSQNNLVTNKVNITDKVSEIKSALEKYEIMLSTGGTPKTDDCFFDVYRDAINAKQESVKLLKELLDCTDESWNIGVTSETEISSYCNAVYDNIYLMLKEELSKAKAGNESCCKISLQTIYDKINIDTTTEQNSIPHQYRLVWKNILESFDKFSTDEDCNVSSCEACTSSSTCNLHKQSIAIRQIKKKNTADFLYKLLLRTPTNGNPSGMPTVASIKDVLASLLKTVSTLSLEDNHTISVMKDGLSYRASLDFSRRKEELQSQLNKEMAESTHDKLLIYETDVLITDRLNEEDFVVNDISVMTTGRNEYIVLQPLSSDSLDNLKKDCTKPKVMKLIDTSKAKEALQ